jgi:hypothetical protein
MKNLDSKSQTLDKFSSPSSTQFNHHLKWSIYYINFLLNITGLFLVSFACIFLLIYENDYFFASFYLKTVSYAFMCIGCLLILISIINLFSNVYKNFILEGANMVCMILLIIALVAQATYIITFTLNGKLLNKMSSNLNNSIKLYDEMNPTLSHTKLINKVQSNFKCCGLSSFQDWELSATINKNYYKSYYLNNEFLLDKNQIAFNVPDSCCVNYLENCGKDFALNSTLNTNGCFDILRKYFTNFSYTVFTICIGAISIISFCILYRLYVGLCFSESDYYLLNLEE